MKWKDYIEGLYKMEQRTREWREARLGIPTASNFDKIITPTGSPSSQAQGYMCRLIGEHLLGRSLEEPISNLKWVRHGLDHEDEAVEEFVAITSLKTERVGFVTNGYGGCSPDRLVMANGALEVKCPSPWKHIDYLLHGPGKDYKPQVQGQMLIGGYNRVYFFSYFPGLPPALVTTERDEMFISRLRTELERFGDALETKLEIIKAKGDIDVLLALETLKSLMPEDAQCG